MRILDKNGNVIENVDNTKGHLVEESIVTKHHEAIEAVKEKGHWETVATYSNGGKDIEWVIDIPAVEAKEAYDEYEKILRFVEFTEEQLASIRINALKRNLRDTDYHILKLMEGATTLEKLSDVIKQRASWRKEINELEKTLKG